MTLVISMFKNTFLLLTKIQHMTLAINMLNNTPPFVYILKCKSIISSIPMYYTKYQYMSTFSLQKMTCADK